RGATALERLGVRVLAGPARDGRVDLDWALTALREAGLWSGMGEGGSGLLGGPLAAGLFGPVALFRPTPLLGGRGGRPPVRGPPPRRLADAVTLATRSPVVAARSGAVSPAVAGDGSYELWYPAGLRYRR